jgi:hypothetical protein
MSTATRRRPLPALAFLLALSVLTGIVWWRVLHRPEPAGNAVQPPVVGQSASCTPGAKTIRLPSPRSVTVVVLNGSGRNLLATRVTGQLKSRGFKTGTPDTTSTLSGVGEIRYGPAGRAGATLLGYHVPGAKLTPATSSGARITLVLGEGFRSLAPIAAVNQAVAGASKPC